MLQARETRQEFHRASGVYSRNFIVCKRGRRCAAMPHNVLQRLRALWIANPSAWSPLLSKLPRKNKHSSTTSNTNTGPSPSNKAASAKRRV